MNIAYINKNVPHSILSLSLPITTAYVNAPYSPVFGINKNVTSLCLLCSLDPTVILTRKYIISVLSRPHCSFMGMVISHDMLLGRWRLSLELFGRVFMEDVGAEPGSVCILRDWCLNTYTVLYLQYFPCPKPLIQ